MMGFFARMILRSKLQKDADAPSRTFLPWDKVSKVALIISASPEVNKSAIDRFIAETKKFVEVFYVEPKSKQPSFGDWICFSRKDKSIFNLPNASVEEQLRQKKYDLVINTSPEQDLFSAAILRFLSAPLKCATGSWMQDANLVVKQREQGSLLTYLDDTIKYLQMIRVA